MLKILVLVLFVVCLVQGKNETNPEQEQDEPKQKNIRPKITDAKLGEHPYVVYIPKAVSAGTLVTKDVVISSARMFFKRKFQGWDVIAGVVSFKDTSSKQTKKISNVQFHPQYRQKLGYNSLILRLYHDISKIQLDSPFDVTDNVKPAKIVSGNVDVFKLKWFDVIDNNAPCYSMGWNCPDVDITKCSGTLKVAELIAQPEFKCTNRNPLGATNMCKKGEVFAISAAVDHSGNNTIYVGDPGAPLICGGYAYGVNTISAHKDEIKNQTYFVLYWPYIDLFNSFVFSHSSALLPRSFLLLLTPLFA